MCRSHALALSTLLLASLVAGCAGDDAPAPAATTPTGPQFGIIEGIVVDEEQLPVADAVVHLEGRGLSNRTGDDGRFAFGGLDPGSYSVFVEKDGFRSTGQTVQVLAGETARIQLALERLIIKEEGYTLVIPVSAFITLSQVTLSGFVGDTCGECEFDLEFDRGPVDVWLEADWEKPAAMPLVADEHFWILSEPRPGGSGEPGSEIERGTWTIDDPAARVKTNNIPHFEALDAAHLRINGGILSVSVQQHVDVWTTFAYADRLPGSYTALPDDA